MTTAGQEIAAKVLVSSQVSVSVLLSRLNPILGHLSGCYRCALLDSFPSILPCSIHDSLP